MKPFAIVGAILCSIILVIPTMLVLAFSGSGEESKQATVQEQSEQQRSEMPPPENLSVAVYRTKANEVENVNFEDYIIGVVASEMPASFSLEALKAQALTARTYIINHILNPGSASIPEGAIVTDTITHQVYHSEQELKKLWGKDYDWKIKKITEAVQATRGQVITYEGNPITATFFSTSNGYTENSEDYWQSEIPYLRSVESSWDTESPKFFEEKTISVSQFQKVLGVTVGTNVSVAENITRTQGNRVDSINIGGKTFTGREIREKLDLASSDFTLERNGNQIIIQTKGWGHGVGLSQYGANGMALDGKNYQEIIKHYYHGVEISPIDSYISHIVTPN